MITLSYPHTGTPTHTLELRNPSMGDEIDQELGTETAFNRNGQAVPVRATSWLEINRMRLSFMPLTKAKIGQAKTFFATTAGLQIKLVDHLNRTWFGFVTSGQNEIVNIQEPCTRQFSLTFEGEIQ